MGLFSRRSDKELAESRYAGRESASEAASRKRREGHRARVFRNGDASGQRLSRRQRRNAT